MAIQVKVPGLGESVKQAKLLKWHKHDGEAVKIDEPLCELESDKANVDMPAEAAGIIHQKKREGDTVRCRRGHRRDRSHRRQQPQSRRRAETSGSTPADSAAGSGRVAIRRKISAPPCADCSPKISSIPNPSPAPGPRAG